MRVSFSSLCCNYCYYYYTILLTVLLALARTSQVVQAWEEWNYTNFPTDDWRDIHGRANGPNGRVGHSMVVWDDDDDNDNPKIVLFGGRDNDIHRPHVARTYKLIQDENGQLKFETYDEKPLWDHYNHVPEESSESNMTIDDICRPQMTCVTLSNATSGNNESCSYSWHPEMNTNTGTGTSTSTTSTSTSEARHSYAQTSSRNKMEEMCGFTTSGLYYNDVWVYDLNANDCDSDVPCDKDGSGWRVLHPGERYGGCRDTNTDTATSTTSTSTADDENGGLGGQHDENRRTCHTPSERWGHGAAMMDSSTMIVYGGYSQECEDYCNDVWAFDFKRLEWERLVIRNDENSQDDEKEKNPGRRWKASMISTHPQSSTSATTSSKPSNDSNNNQQNDDAMILVFGGHRLWHGFAMDNSEENLWENVDTYPKGGYLNDLWTLERHRHVAAVVDDDGDANNNHTTYEWTWTKRQPLESCMSHPGTNRAWEDRNRIRCRIIWPKERSGHAVAYDTQRHGMWIHGGYSAHYPYPSSSSTGSGNGVRAKGTGQEQGEGAKKGFTPFTSDSYFLDDLWFYDIDTGYWKEIRSSDSVSPAMRTDHLMIQFRNILILNGGYSNNKFFNDTWYYYMDENRWLEKTEHVHAHYPDGCTDDMVDIQNDDQCIELSYPHPLQRADEATYSVGYQEILPFQQQLGYTPDPDHPLYFGIVHDAEAFVSSLRDKYEVNDGNDANAEYDDGGNRLWLQSAVVPDGTPIAPFAATAPRQFARKKRIAFNATLTLDIWEWCISVQGEPARHRMKMKGNDVKSIHIPQPRRQTAGWDGCRELRWIHPPSRSGHKGVLVEKFRQWIIYGGLSYLDIDHVAGIHPFTESLNETHATIVVDDMWQFGIDHCPRNCSDHGRCTNGFCKCDPGYYGLDCSNVTCPGSTCYYDDDHVQHCKHCCFDGFDHDDNREDNSYVAGMAKTPCYPSSEEKDFDGFTGFSNGICDGFGTCQCALPFLGEDCSIRDCLDNCNDNGYCSLEFPIARCICNEGYKGNSCQYIECMNNCSFPNGECDYSTGSCKCNPIYSPYNSSQIWTHWQGEDCSFLTPWCGSSQIRVSTLALVSSAMLVIFLR